MLGRSLTLPSGLVLANRLAKSATSECLAPVSGRPTPQLARLYGRFAAGGAGLLITGNVMVDGRHLERLGNVVLERDAHRLDFERWAAAARASGTHILMQLNHPGRQSNRTVTRQPVAPSAVEAISMLSAFSPPRALEESEILDIIERFARAAQLAETAGFSGVQLHAAHGYLISQFLSPRTNRRSDRWGGSLDNRARFLRAIIAAVRARTSSRFTLAVKLNSSDFQRGGFEQDDSLAVARGLEADGVDLLEISGGTYEAPVTFGYQAASTREREAYFLGFAARVREVTDMPLMVTGGFRSAATMRDALARGALDLVGLARPLIMDPDLPTRLMRGEVERAEVPLMPPRSNAIRGLAEFAFFQLQMRRLATGRDPEPRSSVARAVAYGVTHDLWQALCRPLVRQRWINA